MLSSTIRELASLREQVGERVEQAGAATAWRFEVHAVAAGAPPDVQYIGMAASCDLYVVIVASQQSDATEAEYRAAFEDNPNKILAFFVGEGSPDVTDFRALIELRHARRMETSPEALVDPITTAILESIDTGVLVRPLLITDLDRRIERARTAIADVPLILEPRIVVAKSEYGANQVVGLGRRLALAGIGGSGKTMTVAVAARRAARDKQLLPIYVAALEGSTDPTELVRQRLESARFSAPAELVERWAADGRLILIVDGVEGLGAPTRRTLMTSISTWADRFPRCGVVVCARRFSTLELTDFTRAYAAPLGERQMRELIEALGAEGQSLRFSAQVRDIGQWPMWATALIVYGSEARTGLDLLQRLVEARLRTSGMSSQVEQAELRAVAGFVAHDMWPVTTSTVSAMLERIRRWHAESATAATFIQRTPEDILQRLGGAALLEVGEEAAFPHRLIATILAAEHAVADSDSKMHADEELAPFVAALADDDEHVDLVSELLAENDTFVLARYLRLSSPSGRGLGLNEDLQRLAAAHDRWLPAGAALDVVFDDAWIAWRSAPMSSSRPCTSADYSEWRSASTEVITIWPSLPFGEHTPEFVAAADVLSRFRARVLQIDPGGNRWGRMSTGQLGDLTKDRPHLEIEVIDALRRRQAAYHNLAAQLGLIHLTVIDAPTGEPRVTVWLPAQQEAAVSVSWGSDSPAINVVESAPTLPHGRTSTLAILMSGEDLAAAYDDLKRDIETALGCRITARNWARPELVPAWAW